MSWPPKSTLPRAGDPWQTTKELKLYTKDNGNPLMVEYSKDMALTGPETHARVQI